MGDKLHDIGLLIIRLGLGGMLMGHGWPKLAGGQGTWEKLGHATRALGVDVAPVAFGFAASVSEFFGGLLIALGLLYRPALVGLIATMSVAAAMHLNKGDPFTAWSHAVELGIVFLGLLLIGPGRFVVTSLRR